MNRLNLQTDSGILRIPCYINDRELDAKKIKHLLNTMETQLSGQYFPDQELLFTVLKDYQRAANAPLNYGKQAYVCLVVSNLGTLRISCSDSVKAGATVYSYEQFIDLAGQVNTPNIDVFCKEGQIDVL